MAESDAMPSADSRAKANSQMNLTTCGEMGGEERVADTCVQSSSVVFDRLVAGPVAICSPSLLKKHIQELSGTLGFPSLNGESKLVSAQARTDEGTERKSSVGTSGLPCIPSSSQGATLESEEGVRNRVCHAKLRRAVLSPTCLSQMSRHLDRCAAASAASTQSKGELDDARLAWSHLLLHAVVTFWETEGKEPCCADTGDGSHAVLCDDGNAGVSDAAGEERAHWSDNSAEAIRAGWEAVADIEQALDGLLAAIESVLASPSQGGRGLDSCAALLKQTRDAMERRLSAARRDASSLDKALERRQPPPADDGGVEASGETAEECVSRARHRAGLSLVFVNLPSLLCSVAHFVAAAARPPPGQTPGCLLSAPSGVETRDTTSDKHQKEQTELYEKGLLASLKLVRAVILDAAESTDTERYRAPVEEFETDLVEKVIGICTPPNMLWKPEDLVGASNRTKPYERLLPSSMEGYELVFDDGVAKVAGTFSPGFNKPELPNKQRITPERSIRDAVLRVAALIEALLVPLQSLGGSESASTAKVDFPLLDAWRSSRVISLSAEILQALRDAATPAVSSSLPPTIRQPFLTEGIRTRLICRTCSLLLSCKQLPRAFDGSRCPHRRQMLPLELAVDVAAAQTETTPDFFRDKISGVKCLPDGLDYENVVRHAAAFPRNTLGQATTQDRRTTYDFASHLGDTGAMLLSWFVARVFLELLRSLAEHETTDYSRLTIPILLRLVDIPQPHVRRLGWICFSISSTLLSPSDALAFHSPLLRAIHDGFPICNEIPTCVEAYMSAVVSAFEVLFPDPTESSFLSELQFVTNMCIVTLGHEPTCLATCMWHFQAVVRRAKIAVIYIAKDLMKIGLRGVESLTPVAITEGIALIRQLFVELGMHCICYVPEVLCRLLMIYITFISPAADSWDPRPFNIVGNQGNTERLTETQRFCLQNESVLLMRAIRANCTADEYTQVVACLRCTCLRNSSAHEAELRHYIQEFREFCMRCAPI